MGSPTPVAATVDKALVTQFAKIMHLEAEQIAERTKGLVNHIPFKGKDYSLQNLGSVVDEEIIGRFQAVSFQDIAHQDRQLLNRRFKVSIPLDKKDDLEMLVERNSKYAQRAMEALKRRFDRLVVEAALADVKTGPNFGTTITAAADGVLTVNATAGFNYAKMLEVVENYINNEVGNDSDLDFGWLLSGAEHTAAMSEEKLTSGDFVRDLAIEKGRIVKALGGDMIYFGANTANPILAELAAANPLNLSGSDERRCLALAKGAVSVGVVQDYTLEVYKDTRYYDTWVVEVGAMLGATRNEGKLVQEIRTLA